MFATFNFFKPIELANGAICPAGKRIYHTEIRGDMYAPDIDLEAFRNDLIRRCPGNNPFAYRKDLPFGTRPEEWLEIRLWDRVEKIETKIGTMIVLSLNKPMTRGEADTEILFPTGDWHAIHGEIMQDHHCLWIEHEFRITFLEGRPKEFATAYGPRSVQTLTTVPMRVAA